MSNTAKFATAAGAAVILAAGIWWLYASTKPATVPPADRLNSGRTEINGGSQEEKNAPVLTPNDAATNSDIDQDLNTVDIQISDLDMDMDRIDENLSESESIEQ